MIDSLLPMKSSPFVLVVLIVGLGLTACGSDLRTAEEPDLREGEVEYVAFRQYGSEAEFFDGRFSVRIVIKDRESGYLADAELDERGEPSSSQVGDIPIELGESLDLFGYTFRFLEFDPMLDSQDGISELSRWGVSGEGPPVSGCAAAYGASDPAASLLDPSTSVEVEPGVFIRYGIRRERSGAFADPPELDLSVTSDGVTQEGRLVPGGRMESDFGGVELVLLQISDDCRVDRVEVLFDPAS